MADEADVANDYEDARRESLIQAMTQQKPVGPSLSECEECGDEIPKARQEAAKGCRLCVVCGELADVKRVGVKRG